MIRPNFQVGRSRSRLPSNKLTNLSSFRPEEEEEEKKRNKTTTTRPNKSWLCSRQLDILRLVLRGHQVMLLRWLLSNRVQPKISRRREKRFSRYLIGSSSARHLSAARQTNQIGCSSVFVRSPWLLILAFDMANERIDPVECFRVTQSIIPSAIVAANCEWQLATGKWPSTKRTKKKKRSCQLLLVWNGQFEAHYLLACALLARRATRSTIRRAN